VREPNGDEWPAYLAIRDAWYYLYSHEYGYWIKLPVYPTNKPISGTSSLTLMSASQQNDLNINRPAGCLSGKSSVASSQRERKKKHTISQSITRPQRQPMITRSSRSETCRVQVHAHLRRPDRASREVGARCCPLCFVTAIGRAHRLAWSGWAEFVDIVAQWHAIASARDLYLKILISPNSANCHRHIFRPFSWRFKWPHNLVLVYVRAVFILEPASVPRYPSDVWCVLSFC
jgi:hypothetical protein